MAWDPQTYELFQAARLRPGHDLIAALPTLHPERIVDLGCGTGRLTRMLADRYPAAQVVGLDNSRPMLAEATRVPSRVAWELGDIAQWSQGGKQGQPVDLIFSNAALHWVPDHARLFPSLLCRLAPGGVLAVQMPRNFDAPSHALMREVAGEGPWAPKLAGRLTRDAVQVPDQYWRWLSPVCSSVELWETEYLHELDGPDPVLTWVKATGLLPVLETLQGQELTDFLGVYGEKLRRAYPPERNGHTLFPFRRLFLIARN